jgi:hypothetical protein
MPSTSSSNTDLAVQADAAGVLLPLAPAPLLLLVLLACFACQLSAQTPQLLQQQHGEDATMCTCASGTKLSGSLS